MGVSGLEPEMPKPQIYSLLRFQFRSHTHENRRVLKTLLKCSVFPECKIGTPIIEYNIIINADITNLSTLNMAVVSLLRIQLLPLMLIKLDNDCMAVIYKTHICFNHLFIFEIGVSRQILTYQTKIFFQPI